jgi:hypothetical protein
MEEKSSLWNVVLNYKKDGMMDIIFPSVIRSSKWFVSLKPSNQNCICISLLLCVFHVPPFSSSLNNICASTNYEVPYNAVFSSLL